MAIEITNPFFKVNEDSNIFTIRQNEYSQLENKIREILKPAEEAGFTLIDFGIKDSFSHDLEKTIKSHLIIKLQKGETEVDLSCFIPKLVDNNYIVIRGNRKIPMFQLYDLPIVTRGKTIKIRTNILTLMVNEKSEPPFVNVDFMGGSAPLAVLYFCLFPYNEVGEKFELDKINLPENPSNLYEKLIFDLKSYYDSSKDIEQEDFMEELGTWFKATDPKKKGMILSYALEIIPKIDIMTTEFFSSDNLLDEISNVIKNGADINDTDLRNKRIRCFEYVILAKIAKNVFDLCIQAKTSKKFKFNINSSQILSDCTISKVVDYDFTINPISQLTMLTRCSLVGPGGFNKENVPTYLRDIDPSMFGRICPVDTSDRANCGVLQHLLPNVSLDNSLRFTEDKLEKSPISVAVSMVPFVEHDDQTRLQMSASQMRQAITLSDPDVPIIRSGCEGLYTQYSTFIKKARKKGEVVHVDSTFIIVLYDDSDYDIFNIANRETTEENIDVMNVLVSVGDRVNKGDILAESNFCKDGEISIGKNLLAAVMPYYGYNYEDAIVISDRLVKEDILTSVHYIDMSFILPTNKILLSLDKNFYKPLPTPRPEIEIEEPGKDEKYYRKNKRELVLTGKPYAILKEIPDNPLDYYVIFEDKTPILSKKDVLVTNVEIYPNDYNKSINQFKDWVEKTFEAQVSKQKKIQETILKYLPKQEAIRFIKDNGLDRFSARGKFKQKDEKINGMLVSIQGFYTRKICIGDKLGNRHGNKGVISTIVPHNMMPRLPDGRNVDICFNPLGTISRMNLGQIFELHMGMSMMDLKLNLKKMLEEKKSQEELKSYILDYIKIIDNTTDNWYYQQFEEQLSKSVVDCNFVDELTLIQPPFESTSYSKVLEACEYTNTLREYRIFDPVAQTELINSIGVGYMYFFRMQHIAENKLAARGIGSYTRKTMQPPGGRKNRGGQRCGEMETCCLIAHDGMKNLFEFLTTKSDCLDLKNKYIREMIGSEFVKDAPIEDLTPESVKLFNSYLKLIGVDI